MSHSEFYPQKIKVALVHDWLTGMRGGEKCLEVLCEIFPNADIYTLICNPEKISDTIRKHKIHTSYIQKLPFKFEKYRYYLPLFPHAIESFDLHQYELVVSSSHCVAKGVLTSQKQTCHVSYVHAPMRYMWNLFDQYFHSSNSNQLVSYTAQLIRPYLQYWDIKSCKNINKIICNSQNIQKQIQEIYHRESTVIYPPIDLNQFSTAKSLENRKDYYLMVGAFAPNKNVDLAIQAFNELNLPLKIIGSGQTENYCRSIAKENIEFLGNTDNQTIAKLYQEARAFVFPGEDDFGMTPLEAHASGIPVIAYAKGGALETVTNQTGIFFHDSTVQSLSFAIKEMEKKWRQFEPHICVARSQQFSRENYKNNIKNIIQSTYLEWIQHK